MSELYLVRHAQASFAAENYDQLSPLGYRQSAWLGEYFARRNIQFDQHVAGAMVRHQQTLDGISESLSQTEEVLVIPQLNEYDFQQLANAYIRIYPNDDIYLQLQVNDRDKKLYFKLLRRVLTAWALDELNNIPERWSDFNGRVATAIETLQSLAGKQKNILAVSSGGAISAFIGNVLGMSPESIFDLNVQVRNTSISHFYLDRDSISLAGFNAVPHLDNNDREKHITYG